MNIYTIHRQGETIPKLVMEGIVNQSIDCSLIPISQEEGNTPRLNSVNNWIRALEYATDEPFIGMDGDVVMDDEDTIKTLLKGVENVFMATIRTQILHIKCNKDKVKMAHALFACIEPKILRDELIKIRENWNDGCSMCRVIKELVMQKRKVNLIAFPTAYECRRKRLERSK